MSWFGPKIATKLTEIWHGFGFAVNSGPKRGAGSGDFADFPAHKPVSAPIPVNLTSRNLAAYHESGHVVARLIHGLTFARAYVNDDGTGGVLIGNSPPGQAWGASIRALAGPVAEARRTGQPLQEILESQAGLVDHQHAKAALALAGRSMADAIALTERLITYAWPALCAIAEILNATGEIRPPRCFAVINACLEDIE
jgi:hypothetical protein